MAVERMTVQVRCENLSDREMALLKAHMRDLPEDRIDAYLALMLRCDFLPSSGDPCRLKLSLRFPGLIAVEGIF